MSDKPLWTPSPERVAAAELTRFRRRVQARSGIALPGYEELYRWSCEHPDLYWQEVWEHAGVLAVERGRRTLVHGDRMPGARFFPDARLNFAANLLRAPDAVEAIVFRGEQRARARLTYGQLRERVGRLQRLLRAADVGPGDRVAAYLPNLPDAIVGMLATASLGAVWSSCSPDFGVQGVLDRFGQIEPKVLLCADGYFYKGRVHASLPRVAELLPELPSVQRVLVVPYVERAPDLSALRAARLLPEALEEVDAGPLEFRDVGFNDPLYVLFSSGTTGRPKCIVHGVGGTLLKHLAEHRLMCDIRAGDRVFYYTTTGWMMWNWLASALACDATLLLYDGNPFWPEPTALFDFFDAERGTLFGTSAKYIDALRKQGIRPAEHFRLEHLRTITSTGSPLAPEGFDYVYEAIKSDVCLSSISGGTDIVGCFVGGNPTGPVWRGEIQARLTGMAVEVFDDRGRPVRCRKGELVCTRPFPSMPLGFWNDPDGSRYRAAYFERFPGVWHHGDFAEITEHDGVIIYGRSDATLNPGGVRIGTAEIYRVVERLDEVEESIVVGQRWRGDERVVLFVKLRPGLQLDDTLRDRIRRTVRENCSPRHVPARILQVDEIPRTKSGKIVELAVREVVHGRPVHNLEALANPGALEQFADRAELRS